MGDFPSPQRVGLRHPSRSAGSGVFGLNTVSKRKQYKTDLADERWALIEPVIAAWKAARPSVGGHQGRYEMREIANALLYQGRTGCQWDLLPHDLPLRGAVMYYFTKWRDDGADQTIHDLLRWQVREKVRRKADPSLVVLDTQSVHAAAGVPAESMGRDAAKEEDGGLVLRSDLAQVLAEERDRGDVQGVGGVGLAVPAGGQQACARGQGGGDVHHVLACGGQLLGERAAQVAGAFDGEAALGPRLAPAHQLRESAGVDDEAPLAGLVACAVHGDGGVRGLVGVDPDRDHAHPGLYSKRRSMRRAP